MAHDDERVELEDDRDPAEDPLREDEQRQPERPRGAAAAAGAPGDERRDERRQADEEADDAVPELDERVVALLRAGTCSPQRGQFSQPRPEPVSRTVAPLTVTRMSATSAAYAVRRNAPG